jgi:ATP-dependent helicase IRC3
VAGLTNTFRKLGIDARFVTGDTPKSERGERLDGFKAGKFPVLVNCGVFTEGTDIPNIDCVLLARPTKSRNLLVQMIGRGMRLHPGKKDCHIIDMVASLETGIVTTPTLFGLDPSEIVEDANVDDLKGLQDRKEAEELRKQKANEVSKASPKNAEPVSRTVTFIDYDSVFDLIQDTTGEQHVRQISPHAWVCVSEDKYILSNSNGSYVKLERGVNEKSGQEEYLVTETVALSRAISKVPFMRPRTIARAITFTNAIHAADTFALKRYPFQFISKRQAWRNRPATEGQLAFLNKLRSKNDQLTAEALTKGKAGDMITKVKHGAKRRFANIEADRRREGRARLKFEQEKALKERETVSVGPLLY